MRLEVTYRTPDLFTLGELRAIVKQTESLDDEASVMLTGTVDRDKLAGDDAIVIAWEGA